MYVLVPLPRCFLFPEGITCSGGRVLPSVLGVVCRLALVGWQQRDFGGKMAFFTIGCMHVSYKKLKWVKASLCCCSLFITLLFLWPLCHQPPCCVAFLVLKLEANDFCRGCSSCSAVVVIPWLSLSVGYKPGSEWENENFCPCEWVLWGSWMC